MKTCFKKFRFFALADVHTVAPCVKIKRRSL